MRDNSQFFLVVSIGILYLIAGISHPVHAQRPNLQSPVTTYSANGEISSQAAKFILAGTWSLDVKGGNVVNFTADITAALPEGTRLHYHKFSNFHQTPGSISELNADNTGTIHGTMDVGLNNKLREWPQVPTTISIKNATTISIVLNDASKVYPPHPIGPLTTAFAHFTGLSNVYNARTGSQPVNGLVKQLTRTYTITH